LNEPETIEEKERRIVSGWLLYVDDRRQEYQQKKENITISTGPGLVKIPDTKEISKPTERTALKLAELHNTEKWLQLVEDVEANLPHRRLVFLRLRREYRHNRGRQGWTVSVQRRFASEMVRRGGGEEEDHWINTRETFWKWWNDIILFALGMAKGRGLI